MTRMEFVRRCQATRKRPSLSQGGEDAKEIKSQRAPTFGQFSRRGGIGTEAGSRKGEAHTKLLLLRRTRLTGLNGPGESGLKGKRSQQGRMGDA